MPTALANLVAVAVACSRGGSGVRGCTCSLSTITYRAVANLL